MTLNGHFALNSVLRRYVWSSEAWLSKLGYSYTCSECCRGTLNRKEQLRHRAVSLRQHGFISINLMCILWCRCAVRRCYETAIAVVDLAYEVIYTICLPRRRHSSPQILQRNWLQTLLALSALDGGSSATSPVQCSFPFSATVEHLEYDLE